MATATEIKKPNYTQVPNAILDNLDKFTASEVKVIMCVARHTFGYHQKRKRMSLSYIMQATGLSRQGVINAVEALGERGIISRRKSGQSYEYSLHIVDELVNSVDQLEGPASQLSRPVLVNSVDQASQLSRPVLVNSVDPNKEMKETYPKKDKETIKENGVGLVVRCYESNIGGLSAYVAEMIGDAVVEYGAALVEDAIKEAARRNVRNWAYIDGILRRWAVDGRSKPPAKKAQKQLVEYVNPITGESTTEEVMA